jgi:hypothetical protein
MFVNIVNQLWPQLRSANVMIRHRPLIIDPSRRTVRTPRREPSAAIEKLRKQFGDEFVKALGEAALALEVKPSKSTLMILWPMCFR